MPPMDGVPADLSDPRADGTAARMPLVHVCSGRAGRQQLWEFVVGEIPTSAEANRYAGSGARFVEDQLGYPRSVYFYAGRAHPGYGQVALAFPPGSEAGRLHTVTPFDTGGVAKREADLPSAFRLNLAPDSVEGRVEFCRRATIAADHNPGWRVAFARWLAYYFPTSSVGYWDRPPERPDPDGMYTSNTDWPAWTWEIRFAAGPRVLDAERWAADPAHMTEVRRHLAETDLTPEQVDELEQFFGRLETPAGDFTFNEALERWIRSNSL
ncbi:MAG: hypothetical protein JWO38_6639 [Gemmataceae bacterium]|nr:hypothetical protein [Gemmataceae bacterium]